MNRDDRLRLDLTAAPTTIRLDQTDATPPALPDTFDPWLTRADLDRLLRLTTPGEVYRPWLVYAGATPRTPADRAQFHTKPETQPHGSLYHATARLWDRRTSIRYATADVTPFRLTAAARTTLTTVGNPHRWEGDTLDPEAACLRNVSYWSDGRPRTVDPSITINPIQSCAMRCGFCRRQYDQLDGALRADPLLNLSPQDMAAHLLRKYPAVDWSSRVNIAVVTGTFADFDHLHDWTARFGHAMQKETGGAYDPARTAGQNIHILTHLIRGREQMVAVRDLGVKTVQDTAEIIDDTRRVEVMPKANPRNTRLVGKADVSWADVVGAVGDGVDVFGRNGWYTTVILGLDDKATTLRGLEELFTAGLRWLDRPVYQPFSPEGLHLYQMAARDLIETNIVAGRRFGTVSTTWNPNLLPRPAGAHRAA